MHRRLDDSLPTGLDVLEVVPSAGGSLADRLQASQWRMRLPGVEVAEASAAVARFLDAGEVLVERMTKRGMRSFDCREAVISARVSEDTSGEKECAILEVVLRHGSPSVRPDDVLAGLREVAGLDVGAAVLHQRLAQGPLDELAGTVGDPLAADRDAV